MDFYATFFQFLYLFSCIFKSGKNFTPMLQEKKKMDLRNFVDFENFFVEEGDDLKLCIYTSLLFDNWPFKMRKNRYWNKINKKIGKILDVYHSKYFDSGFQYKPFTARDKIVICTLCNLIQRIFNFSEEPGIFKGVNKLLSYALSFDKDVMLCAFKAIYMIGELSNLSKSCAVQQEILYKLADLDVTLSDLLPQIKDKVFKPIRDLKILDSEFDAFKEYSKNNNITDVYITIIRQLFGSEGGFLSVMKQNAILILFQNLDADEYYHRLSSNYSLLSLEGDRDLFKSLDINLLIENSRNTFIEIIEEEGLSKCLEDIYTSARENIVDCESCIDHLKKHVCFINDIHVELYYSFIRYLIFSLGYSYNFVHLVFILELDRSDGIFYTSLEDALKYPVIDKIGIFTLLELLIRTENQNVLNNSLVHKMMLTYLSTQNNDTLQVFLQTCYIFVKDNDSFYLEVLQGDFVDKSCKFIEKCDRREIIVILLDILFYLYKKQNTRLEPFEESKFLGICIELVNRLDNEVSTRSFKIITYFINSDPLCIETLIKSGVGNVLGNIENKSLSEDLGISLINFIDALSLNIEYGKELRKRKVFSSMLSGLKLYDVHKPILPENGLTDSISIFLRHHPEYNEEYVNYYLNKLREMNRLYESRPPSDEEFPDLENFLDSFRHFKTNVSQELLSKHSDEMIIIFVDLYSRICLSQDTSKNTLFNILQMFVTIFGLLGSERKVIESILPRIKDSISEIEECKKRSKRMLIPIMKAEKLISLVVGIINNFFEVKIDDSEMFKSIFESSMSLFTLTVEYIQDMFDIEILDRTFISAYLCYFTRLKKENSDVENLKVYSMLICVNLVFLLKFSVDEFHVEERLSSGTFLGMFLNQISKCIEHKKKCSKNDAEKVKRPKTVAEKYNDNKENLVLYFGVLKQLNTIFTSDMIQLFCLWVKKHKMFKDEDHSIKKSILEIFGSTFPFLIDKKYKEMILEFLQGFDAKNVFEQSLLLKAVSNIFYNEEDLDKENEAILSKVVSRNYYPGAKNKVKFLMKNIDFVVDNIIKKNYGVFIDNITEDSLDYITFLLNYHFDSDLMFSLLSNAIEVLTFFKKKADRGKLMIFLEKFREKGYFKEKYDFEDTKMNISETEMADKEGNLKIKESLILEKFMDTINITENSNTPLGKSNTSSEIIPHYTNIQWSFLLISAKYYEVRLEKLHLLVDVKILTLCLLQGFSQDLEKTMLIFHYIFGNLEDLFTLRNEIVSKRGLLNFYGLENDKHDFIPLVYRNPNLIHKKAPEKEEASLDELPMNDVHNTIVTPPVFFFLMMNEAFDDKNALFVLSEIIYNYPRYISFIDLYFIKRIVGRYLGSTLEYIKDVEAQGEAKRVFEFLSVCFHSLDPGFIKCFVEFVKETLGRNDVNEICGLIFILCNISNPLVVSCSVLEQQERDRNIYLGFKELLKEGVIDLFIKVISKIEEKDLPNLKELSHDPESLMSELGIKNLNLFLVQNRFDYLSTYEVSEFNLNTFSDFSRGSDHLLSIAFNFVYNIYYSTYQKEIEDSGILDIEMSDNEIEHEMDSNETFYNEEDESGTEAISSSTIYNDTPVNEEEEEEEEEVQVDIKEDIPPVIKSTYLRLESDYKDLDDNKRDLIFDHISEYCPSDVEDDSNGSSVNGDDDIIDGIQAEESNDINDDIQDDESSVGVLEGYIPEINVEELNALDDFELEEFISNLTEERKATNLEYKAIDKEFLQGLEPRLRSFFESYEELLKDFYSPEVEVLSDEKETEEAKGIEDLEVFLGEENVCNLLDNFIEGKYSCKPQVYNIFKILSLSRNIRKAILHRAMSKLEVYTEEVTRVDCTSQQNVSLHKIYESLRKCIEMIRLIISKHPLEEKNSSLVGCLFSLLRHKEISIKALCLLNSLEFSVGDEGSILFDLMGLVEMWLNKKSVGYLRNTIRKISKAALDTLIEMVVEALRREIQEILKEEEILPKYVEAQNKITNLVLMFNSSFSSFFEKMGESHREELERFFYQAGMEYKSLERVDYKYLRGCISSSGAYGSSNTDTLYTPLNIHTDSVHTPHNTHTFTTSDIPSFNLIGPIHTLVTEGIEKVISRLLLSKVESYYSSGLYNVYFFVVSAYEGLMNFFLVLVNDHSTNCLMTYDKVRSRFTHFLDSNVQEINSLFSTEMENVEFLSRFNVINFVNKHNYFRGKIHQYKEGSYTINVRRRHILSDSLFQIMNKTSKEFKTKRLQVKFSGEEGLDFGGLTREWLDLLVKDITNPDLGLFIYTSEKKTTLLPYRNSKINSDHLLYFRFVGRILAKSILDRTTLDLHIDRSAYKYFLGKKCELSDLEPIDPQFFNSLLWIRDNPIENVISLTFSTEYSEFGDTQVVDLKPNGRNIPVTDTNKLEYIELIVDYKLFKGIETQLNAIKMGLFEIVDRDLLAIFNENEFELLISGIPEINVDDWMNNTEYYGYKNNSPNIIWFWKAVRSFSPEEKAKLLQFSTGSSRVPFEGFSHLQGSHKFSIHKAASDNIRLPSAHTCFNQLDLPEYSSFNELRKSLLYAINECSEGFGMI